MSMVASDVLCFEKCCWLLRPLRIQFPFVLTFLLALGMTSIKSIFVSFNWDGLVWWLNTIVSPHDVDTFKKFYE